MLDLDYFGQVHSVFNQTVNISTADSRLYSIAAAHIDNAPHNIRVAAPMHFSEMGIQPGDKVEATPGKLLVGKLTIDLADIVLWESILPEFPCKYPANLLEDNTKIMRKCIASNGKSGGLWDVWFSKAACCNQNVFIASLTERAQAFLTALRSKRFDDAYRTGCKLIGLGGGLTPSGDDFCAALLTVMNMPGSPFSEKYQSLGYRLAEAAVRQTTAISQEMLITAAEGQARENVITLLREVISGSEVTIEAAALKVLQMGSLSGTDWAVGLTAGLELGRELAEISEQGGN
ncbi:hypothetical protein SRRS_09670 [Sporomusa rhizae]|uniref:DUF2877 domain-containing protein n=1 Tax=Sporomusa rhizae TaxID=357999 RepID=UPI00352A488D